MNTSTHYTFWLTKLFVELRSMLHATVERIVWTRIQVHTTLGYSVKKTVVEFTSLPQFEELYLVVDISRNRLLVLPFICHEPL
jgi:hypothetical protein